MVDEMGSPPRAVILDAAAQDELDLTSVGVLQGLVRDLHGRGIDVYFADVHAPVREHARQAGLLADIGEDHVLPTVDLAVRHVEGLA